MSLLFYICCDFDVFVSLYDCKPNLSIEENKGGYQDETDYKLVLKNQIMCVFITIYFKGILWLIVREALNWFLYKED